MTPRRWPATLVVLGGLSAFGPLSIDMYLPAMPRMSDDLGTGDLPVQLTLTACLVGLALGQALAGPVSDTLGRRRPLLASLVAYTVASLLCAIAPDVWVLIGLRLLQGLAGAAGIVIARAVIRDLRSGPSLARLFALVMAINGLAPILAPIIGAQVLRIGSWRWVFVILAAVGALLLAGVAALLPESLPAERRHPGSVRRTLRIFGELSGDRRFVGCLLATGLSLGAMFAYISASPFVLQQVHGLSAAQFSLVFGANALGIVALSQLSALLVGRVGPTRLLVTGTLLQGVATLALLAVVSSRLWALLGALFVAVAAVGLVLPNATALALSDHGDHAGSASALLGTFQFAVGAVTPALLGVPGMSQSVAMGVVMAVLAVGGVAACAALVRRPRSPAAVGPAGMLSGR